MARRKGIPANGHLNQLGGNHRRAFNWTAVLSGLRRPCQVAANGDCLSATGEGRPNTGARRRGAGSSECLRSHERPFTILLVAFRSAHPGRALGGAMITRRFLCGCIPLVAASAITSRAFGANAECAVYTHDRQRALSSDKAIGLLKEGNERFASGRTVNCDLLAQAKETSTAQAPFAAIVGCMDSRVPPELVFDQKIGDVFSVRIAGNFAEKNIIGSLEFATKVTGVRAIVVLGHNSCGAIRGAIDDVQLGNLTATLANIRPAVASTLYEGDRSAGNSAFVQAVAEENVRRTVALLTQKSEINAALVEAGELRIVGAMHDLATGRVTFLL